MFPCVWSLFQNKVIVFFIYLYKIKKFKFWKLAFLFPCTWIYHMSLYILPGNKEYLFLLLILANIKSLFPLYYNTGRCIFSIKLPNSIHKPCHSENRFMVFNTTFILRYHNAIISIDYILMSTEIFSIGYKIMNLFYPLIYLIIICEIGINIYFPNV